VTVKFTNPDANWQSDSVIYPEAGSAEETQFLSEDNGEELAKTVTMNTITNKYSAKDIAKIICLASRQNELTVKVTATSEALEIAVADVVRLEFTRGSQVTK
jgi:phosphotransferase system HPr-like phosphotransfer protein